METLKLLPLGLVDRRLCLMLARAIRKKFGCRVRVAKRVERLDAAYRHSCGQYSVDRLLRLLAGYREPPNIERVLAVTLDQLFDKSQDVIAGYAHFRSRVGVVSLSHLVGAKLRRRMVVTAFHELAHMYGLTHCKNDCLMRWRESSNEKFGLPSHFCRKCARQLREVRG